MGHGVVRVQVERAAKLPLRPGPVPVEHQRDPAERDVGARHRLVRLDGECGRRPRFGDQVLPRLRREVPSQGQRAQQARLREHGAGLGEGRVLRSRLLVEADRALHVSRRETVMGGQAAQIRLLSRRGHLAPALQPLPLARREDDLDLSRDRLGHLAVQGQHVAHFPFSARPRDARRLRRG
jgi:hypothetical protein